MTIDIPDTYFGVDSAHFAQGRPMSAVVQRTLARNANRMAVQGGLICGYNWDARTSTVAQVGGYWARLDPNWDPIISGIGPRNPMCRLASLYVWALIPTGRVVHCQVISSKQPLTDRTVGNTLSMTGDGTMKRYTLNNIPLARGLTEERVAFYIRGDEGGTLATVTDNTGVVDEVYPSGVFVSNGSTQHGYFNANYRFRYFVEFVDGSGNRVWPDAFKVEWKSQTGTPGDDFWLSAPFQARFAGAVDAPSYLGTEAQRNAKASFDEFSARVRGNTYNILDPLEVQLGHISLWESDAT